MITTQGYFTISKEYLIEYLLSDKIISLVKKLEPAVYFKAVLFERQGIRREMRASKLTELLLDYDIYTEIMEDLLYEYFGQVEGLEICPYNFDTLNTTTMRHLFGMSMVYAVIFLKLEIENSKHLNLIKIKNPKVFKLMRESFEELDDIMKIFIAENNKV